MRNYIFTIILFFTLSFHQLYGQSFDEKDFTLYTTKDGLSDNRVTDITQDAYGYLWIATRQGLNRFDGNSFRTFYADSNGNSLPQDELIKLKWLNHEQLAASTIGMHIVNTRTLGSRNIIIPAGDLKYEYKVNAIQDMLGDNDGNIFILTRSGFYQYSNTNEMVFRYDYYKKEHAETRVFVFGRSMIRINNSILMATYEGLYIYDIKKKEIHPINSTDDPFYRQIANPKEWFRFMHGNDTSFSVQMEGATALHYYDIKNKKRYLISAPFTTMDKFDWRSKLFQLNDTLFAINGKQTGFYLVHYKRETKSFAIQPQLYFKNSFCSGIHIDRNKKLWIGTNTGLFAEKRFSGNVESMIIPQELNPFNKDLKIKMITIAKNKLFVGTTRGMIVLDHKTLLPIKKINLFHPDDNSVFNTITIDQDTVLATIDRGLAWINSKNLNYGKVKLPYRDSSSIESMALFKDSRNSIYMSDNRLFAFYFRPAPDSAFQLLSFKDNKLFNILATKHIAEDPDGNIWFAGNGYSRYNPQLREFDMKMDSFPALKMPRKEVTRPLFYNGKIYFGVSESGLLIYDPANKKFEQFTRNNGLPSNTVEALYLYHDKIWLGTGNGIASFDIATKKISSFGVMDNMPPDPFTAYSFYFDSIHQHLYAGFNNTLVRFNPDKLTKNNSPPLFFIENIVVAGTETRHHPGDKIALSYKNNNLVINLAAINFEDAHQQQFAYRLVKNGNEEWQETGSQQSIIISNLAPGKHKLQTKVYIRNNSWPEQVKEITISVSPPFWKTTWFILLLSILILSSLYGLYVYRIKSIRQKANIDKALAELEIKGLHAQMNPHFIFNSLNSIKEMILEDQKQNASRYLSKFAQLIRTNLEQSRQTFITVKQGIDHLHQYLEMEKTRFADFSYSIKVEDDLLTDDMQMAPMLIQPLVENAIWHGLQNKEGDKKIVISFFRSGEQLVCEIDDNGIGIFQSKKIKTGMRAAHRSVGITNIQERLVVLNEKYKMNCSLTIQDKSILPGHHENGTLAILRLNIKNTV